MVEGEGTGSTKKVFEGQEYDYVFDIDIEDGKPPLKLPYNLTESSWEAARKFLERNELPMTYYEQVANWIAENTRGAKFGQDTAPSSQQPSQGADPWGTDRRYRPGDAGSSSGKLPQRTYIDIVEGNPANAISIITQRAEELSKSGAQSLSPDEISAIQPLITQLDNKQDPRPTEAQVSTLIKISTQWPQKARVPAVGVLARLAVSPSFVNAITASDKTIVDVLQAGGLLAPQQETANNVVHSIRLLANIFKSDVGRVVVNKNFDAILKLVRPFSSQPESPAQFKALAALYLNYAVLLTSNAPASEAASREARANALIMDIAMLAECQSPHASDADGLYRTMVALGTLLSLSSNFRGAMKAGLGGSLQLIATKPAAAQQNVKEIIQEIRELLR